jgi:hypothetical protein
VYGSIVRGFVPGTHKKSMQTHKHSVCVFDERFFTVLIVPAICVYHTRTTSFTKDTRVSTMIKFQDLGICSKIVFIASLNILALTIAFLLTFNSQVRSNANADTLDAADGSIDGGGSNRNCDRLRHERFG